LRWLESDRGHDERGKVVARVERRGKIRSVIFRTSFGRSRVLVGEISSSCERGGATLIRRSGDVAVIAQLDLLVPEFGESGLQLTNIAQKLRYVRQKHTCRSGTQGMCSKLNMCGSNSNS
jgi:hypothetical protein